MIMTSEKYQETLCELLCILLEGKKLRKTAKNLKKISIVVEGDTNKRKGDSIKIFYTMAQQSNDIVSKKELI